MLDVLNQDSRLFYAPPPPFERLALLGVPVHNLTLSEAIDAMMDMLHAYSIDGRARYVATVNVDFLVNTLGWRRNSFKHPELAKALRSADLATADGMPLVWLSKLLGTPLRERVTGADMAVHLMDALAREGKSVFLLGGAGNTAEEAAHCLKAKHPGLRIAGTLAPRIDVAGPKLADAMARDAEIVEAINKSGADVLMLGLGNPKQEIWFQRIQSKLRVPITLGLGGTFDFLSGRTRRAPKWMQNWGLEWLFRLCCEPRRLFKRYFIGGAKMLWMSLPLLLNTWKARLKRGSPVPLLNLDSEAVSDFRPLSIDLSHVNHLNPIHLGTVVDAIQSLPGRPQQIRISGISTALRRSLEAARVWDVFETKADVELGSAQSHEQGLLLSSFSEQSPTIRLKCHGPLGYTQVCDAQHTLDGVFQSDGDVEIDLKYCDAIDNTGVCFLVSLHRSLEQQQRSLRLMAVQPTVHQMLWASGVSDILHIY